MSRLTVAIGYDSREPVTLQVAAHSIVTRASAPVTILPIARQHLRDVYTRTDAAATTEFSLTRFLTPWLSHYEGWSLFVDSDVLCLTDIYEVFADMDGADDAAVYCCQHDYAPKLEAKATGAQTAYPRKNWSSVMLFNNRRCRALTTGYVNTATPAELHRFAWVPDALVGRLPLEWNWLVGEYEPNPRAKLLHYTLGAPCFPAYRRCDHAEVWWKEHRAMSGPMSATEMADRLLAEGV